MSLVSCGRLKGQIGVIMLLGSAVKQKNASV